MKTEDYKGIFGSLLYTAMQTSPDILAIVTLLSRFPENPGRVHWVAAKRVLCYLKRSKDLELCYTKDSGADAETLVVHPQWHIGLRGSISAITSRCDERSFWRTNCHQRGQLELHQDVQETCVADANETHWCEISLYSRTSGRWDNWIPILPYWIHGSWLVVKNPEQG